MDKNYSLNQLRGAWGAGKGSSQYSPRCYLDDDMKIHGNDPLVGKFFSVVKNGRYSRPGFDADRDFIGPFVNMQGIVREKIDADNYFVTFYSALDGHLDCKLEKKSIAEMESWIFHASDYDMRRYKADIERWPEREFEAQERFLKLMNRIKP